MGDDQLNAEHLCLNPAILAKALDGDDNAQLLLGNTYFKAVYNKDNCFNAFEWFLCSAKQGNMEAQFRLADLYALGHGVKQSHETAFEWYTKAALQGYKKAMIRIHNLVQGDKKMHCRGQLSSEEEEWASDAFKKENHIRELNEYRLEQHQSILNHAIEYYSRCFNTLNSTYQLNSYEKTLLAFLFEHGYGGKQSILRAIDLYKEAAEQGHIDAQYSLAKVYQENENIKFHYRLALRWYRVAAVNGNIAAQNCLAFFYEKGFTTEVYLEGAVYWYSRAASAGNSSAQLNLGRLYRKGEGMSQSFSESAKWYKLAANKGNKVAQNCLNQLIQRGKITVSIDDEDTAQSSIDAFSTYTLCLKLQNDIAKLDASLDIKRLKKLEQHALMTDGNTMYQIGLNYYNGIELPQDKGTGFQWMKKAAKGGIQEAKIKIAEMYKNGDTVEQDYHESSIWTMQLAKKKNHKAQYNLGLLYKNGLGLRKDALEASKWFIKSGDQENTDAQYQLALLQRNGEGVQQDDEKAFRLFRSLAFKKHSKAFYNLGDIYSSGNLVKAAEIWMKQIYGDKNFKKNKSNMSILMYKTAARLKHTKSHFKLGEIYEEGVLIQQDLSKSLEYYTFAASSGCYNCERSLAIKYLNGIFDDPGYTIAYDLIQKMAKKESTEYPLIKVVPSIWKEVHNPLTLVNMLTLASERGIEGLDYSIGYFYEYYDLYSSEKDLVNAIKWYSTAADQGESRAQYRLGNMYREGVYVEKDSSLSIRYYLQAYQNGSSEAAYGLGLMYLNGDGVSQDLIAAFHLFTEASNMGYKLAHEMLEAQNESTMLDSSNQSNKIYMLESVANVGNIAIQYQLGIYYEYKDVDKSFHYYNLAANGRVTDAYYRMGKFYEEDRCTFFDYTDDISLYGEAIFLYQKAVAKDHERALFKLAQIYHLGEIIDIDYLKAYVLYERAAKLGHIESQHILNILEIPDDCSKLSPFLINASISMLEYVAEEEDNADLQYKLGSFYKNSSHNKDYDEAFKWFEMATKNNHTEATYELALLYENGLGVQQNYTKSFELYSRAKSHGSHNAIYRLGIAYQNGHSVVKNNIEAVNNFKKAAELGNPESQYKLGALYEAGDTVAKDIKEALIWYTKAYLNNSNGVVFNLYNMYNHEPYESFFYKNLFQILSKFDKTSNTDSSHDKKACGLLHYKLGKMYANGVGTTKNSLEAVKQFRKAYHLYSYDKAKQFLITEYDSPTFLWKNYNVEMLDAYYNIRDIISAYEQYKLGTLYYNGYNHIDINQHLQETTESDMAVHKNDSKAYTYFELASQRNYPDAHDQLGLMYLGGYDAEKDDEKAMYFFKKAAEKMEAQECYKRGIEFYGGYGVAKNFKISLIYLVNAAERGHIEAQIQLRDMYLQGNEVEKNYNEAIKWISRTIENMDRNQCYDQGMKYYKGDGVVNSYNVSVLYLQKAAEENHYEAQAQLGVMYFQGYNVKITKEKANQWVNQSINNMKPDECYSSGMRYYKGHKRKGGQSYELAFIYLQKAAEKNHSEAQAQLGLMYLRGKGVAKNYEKAKKLIESAIEKRSLDECYKKGIDYYNGFGTTRNYDMSFIFLQKAAEENHGEAQAKLGEMYFQGLGVEKNEKKAMEWIEKSARTMNAQQCYEHGLKYITGIHTTKNVEIALIYWQKAAENNHRDAQERIKNHSLCYMM